MSLESAPMDAARRLDAATWAALRSRGHILRGGAPHALIPADDKTERRMALVQWLVMPLVLAGCVLPLPRPHEPRTHVFIAAAIMALHPLLYLLLGRLRGIQGDVRDGVLTASDITVATLVFYATAARPGYAQVLLYCAVALAATRYAPHRAIGITSLVALLLLFAALLPLHVALPTLASEVVGLYALTYLVGLLSQAEKAVGAAAVENAQLAQTVLQRNRELSAINRLSRTLNASTGADEVLRLGLAGIAEAMELVGLRAYLVENARPRLVADSDGVVARHEESARTWRAEAARAVLARHTVVEGEERHDETWTAPRHPFCVSVPLVVHDGVAAVIQADIRTSVAPMAQSMVETLEIFCGELTGALENALLRGEAHRIAILQEKNRIAQELHDTVLQMLFSVGLRLQWSLERLRADSALRQPLTEARHLSARAGEELRGAIFTLSSDIAEVGLVAAVERLVADQATKAAWSINVVTSGTVSELPVLVQNAAHRVAREALMNAYKHAQASEVVVSLRFTLEQITVAVQDNGVGITAEALSRFRHTPDHFGLRTVAEQVEGLGGTLSVYGDGDECGTVVKAVIPVASSQLIPVASKVR